MTTLPRIIGRILHPFLRMGIGRLKWVYPIWEFYARHFIGNILTVRVEGLTVCTPASNGFGFNLLTEGSWEPFCMELFKKRIEPGMTVVDVGAHVGLYSLVGSTLVGSTGKVYAFEPEPSNYNLLLKNMKANGLINIVPVRKAVSDKSGATMLFVNPKASTGHTITAHRELMKSISCEMTSLDESLSGQRVDFVKIDVEGAEIAVLRGMRRVISENPRIQLLCEFAPDLLSEAEVEPRDLLEQLAAYGFTIYKLDSRRREMVRIIDLFQLSSCYLFCTRE